MKYALTGLAAAAAIAAVALTPATAYAGWRGGYWGGGWGPGSSGRRQPPDHQISTASRGAPLLAPITPGEPAR